MVSFLYAAHSGGPTVDVAIAYCYAFDVSYDGRRYGNVISRDEYCVPK
jgi:hypothetical protein